MKKYALVTGASQGLGLCICRELIYRGYTVFALSRSISGELKALEGESLCAILCDIGNDASVINAEKAIPDTPLDLIINNAGIWLDVKRQDLLDPELEFDTMTRQYEVNALGTLRIAKAFMPRLLHGRGRVMVNVSSEAGSIGECKRRGEYGYCMSKAAQNMATKILANDFSRQGIKLYAFHPGWMITSQGLAGARNGSSPKQDPADTAKILIDLAEGTPKDGIFYGVDGKEIAW